MHTAACYDESTDEERHLVDRFLARSVRYQATMLDTATRLGLDHLDAGTGESVAHLVDRVLAAVAAQESVGRSSAGFALNRSVT